MESGASARRSSHAFRREAMTPTKAKESNPTNSKVSARRSLATFASKSLEGENGTPNTRAGDERSGRYARYSMASSTSKDVPPDAKMLTLLQQYREAQEERLRIEGARSSFPNSQPPVQSSFVDEMEQVAHGAQGKYVSVLESEVTDLKSRLAEAERRASVLCLVAPTYQEAGAGVVKASKGAAVGAAALHPQAGDAGSKRESLLPAPIFALAAEAEGGSGGGGGEAAISEALLRNTLAEKYDALAPGPGGMGMQSSEAPAAGRAKGMSLGGLPASKPPLSSAGGGAPRRRVTVGSCEPQYMDGSKFGQIFGGHDGSGGDRGGAARSDKGGGNAGQGGNSRGGAGFGRCESSEEARDRQGRWLGSGVRLAVAGSAVAACAALATVAVYAARGGGADGVVGDVVRGTVEAWGPYVTAAQQRAVKAVSCAAVLVSSLVNSKVEVHLS